MIRNRSFVAVCGLLVALFAAAGAVYAYDNGRKDLIAEGVRIGNVDVGGLRADAGRTRLREALLTPLQEPVVVRHKSRRFTLTAEQARVGVDIDGTVDAALARSREGNLFSRTARDLTGGEVRAELPVDITYDRGAVTRLVRRVAKAVDRPAVDADVDLSNGDISPRPSRDGRRLRTGVLRNEIGSAVTSLDGGVRTIRAVVKRVRPKVSTEQLADRYPAILIVDRPHFRLRFYKNLRLEKTYKIAVGQVGLETPAGLYHIQNKAIDPAWHVPDKDWAGKLRGKVIPGGTPENPLKARWMGIYDGAGIHGTDAVASLGSAASHGCVRMAIPDVVELYEQVPVNAPVYVS